MGGEAEKPGTATATATATEPKVPNFDHERLHVYWVAREFHQKVTKVLQLKMRSDFRNQLHRASASIVSNIGEGAGKRSKPDKRRYYEIAKGSATEAATQLDMLNIEGILTDEQFHEARRLLIRVAQMLDKLCRGRQDR